VQQAATGIFVALEGIDGSGKTTQAGHLSNRLEAQGIPVTRTREPSDGRIGALIRSVVAQDEQMAEEALALLYAADRIEHLTSGAGILAALKAGRVVVSDRYLLSTYAYHSHKTEESWVVAVNSAAARLVTPQLTILLDIQPELAMRRLASVGRGGHRYEKLDYLVDVRSSYLHYAVNWPNCVVLNGAQDEKSLAAKIWQLVEPYAGQGPESP
jgi:dTMP kinase